MNVAVKPNRKIDESIEIKFNHFKEVLSQIRKDEIVSMKASILKEAGILKRCIENIVYAFGN